MLRSCVVVVLRIIYFIHQYYFIQFSSMIAVLKIRVNNEPNATTFLVFLSEKGVG